MAMTVDIAGSSIDNNTLRVAETSSDEEVDKRHVERSASPSDAHDDSSLFSGGDSDSGEICKVVHVVTLYVLTI